MNISEERALSQKERYKKYTALKTLEERINFLGNIFNESRNLFPEQIIYHAGHEVLVSHQEGLYEFSPEETKFLRKLDEDSRIFHNIDSNRNRITGGPYHDFHIQPVVGLLLWTGANLETIAAGFLHDHVEDFPEVQQLGEKAKEIRHLINRVHIRGELFPYLNDAVTYLRGFLEEESKELNQLNANLDSLADSKEIKSIAKEIEGRLKKSVNDLKLRIELAKKQGYEELFPSLIDTIDYLSEIFPEQSQELGIFRDEITSISINYNSGSTTPREYGRLGTITNNIKRRLGEKTFFGRIKPLINADKKSYDELFPFLRRSIDSMRVLSEVDSKVLDSLHTEIDSIKCRYDDKSAIPQDDNRLEAIIDSIKGRLNNVSKLFNTKIGLARMNRYDEQEAQAKNYARDSNLENPDGLSIRLRYMLRLLTRYKEVIDDYISTNWRLFNHSRERADSYAVRRTYIDVPNINTRIYSALARFTDRINNMYSTEKIEGDYTGKRYKLPRSLENREVVKEAFKSLIILNHAGVMLGDIEKPPKDSPDIKSDVDEPALDALYMLRTMLIDVTEYKLERIKDSIEQSPEFNRNLIPQMNSVIEEYRRTGRLTSVTVTSGQSLGDNVIMTYAKILSDGKADEPKTANERYVPIRIILGILDAFRYNNYQTISGVTHKITADVIN